MKPSVITLFAFIALSASLLAQASDPVLMTINNKPVLKSEFEYIYNKNNTNNSLDKKTLEEYVDLFVNFKLKVEEAKTQGIDTTKSFITELSGYRSQLTKPYLTDSKVDESVLIEAYNRLKEDVDVSHVLIRIQQNATPADTLKAWTSIQSVLKRLQKNEDFSKVAKEVSEDPSAADHDGQPGNGGHLGYISAFRTVYPFETMAYNTPVGSLSKVVRSAFGYHIIKVHGRRNSMGEVLVSHIMKFTSKEDEEMNKKAKISIDSIYKRVLAGEDFGKLATDLSQDKGSAVKNGELPWFGTGRMVPEFETAAFALKNVGDVSQPIQSAYGWHIIKLLEKKGVDSFENMKAELERKVKRDERANLGQQAFVTKLKFEYNFEVIKNRLSDFYNLTNNKESSESKVNELNNSLASKIYFDSGKSSLNIKSKLALIDFAKLLTKNKISKIKIIGFSDNSGKLSINNTLSKTRAKTVANFLIRQNVHSEQIIDVIGKGISDSISTNLTNEGKSANRRVEIYTSDIIEKNNSDKSILTETKLSDSTFLAEANKLNKPLFSFAGKNYSQSDFANYLKTNNNTEKTIASEMIDEKFKAFTDAELLAYEDTQLEKKYDDFRFLMNEYHDGILLFEVSNKEVWDKASKDTEGLEKYFKEHKADYTWKEPHYKGRIISCKDKETFKAAKSIVKKSPTDSIDKYLRTRLNDSIQYVKIEKGLFVKGENKFIDSEIFKSKEKFVPSTDYPYLFLSGKMLKNIPEDYSDVRGLVTADYQEFLEKEWIKTLRGKYSVTVDQNILKTVKTN